MDTQQEIIVGLSTRFDDVVDWFAARGDDRFTVGPPTRWTEGQQLDHLIRSTKPLNMALRLPRMALRLKFGTTQPNGEGYEELVERYEGVLTQGGRASGRFVPPEVRLEDKPRLLESFRNEGSRLVEVAGKWKETDLDIYQLPHPLLGNLSIRQMLQFTYHHMGHHLETLQRDY